MDLSIYLNKTKWTFYTVKKTRPGAGMGGGLNGPHYFSLKEINTASPGREKIPEL